MFHLAMTQLHNMVRSPDSTPFLYLALDTLVSIRIQWVKCYSYSTFWTYCQTSPMCHMSGMSSTIHSMTLRMALYTG